MLSCITGNIRKNLTRDAVTGRLTRPGGYPDAEIVYFTDYLFYPSIFHLDNGDAPFPQPGFLEQLIDGFRPFLSPQITLEELALALPAYYNRDAVRPRLESFGQIGDIDFTGAWQRNSLELVPGLAVGPHRFRRIKIGRAVKNIDFYRPVISHLALRVKTG
jgi:hypothetical protein